MDAPASPAEARLATMAGAPATDGELDLRAAAIRSVIWATGYSLDFRWVELPVFDACGQPVHRRGITAAPGISFLGLAWLHKPTSSFLCGVGEDASYLAERMEGERG